MSHPIITTRAIVLSNRIGGENATFLDMWTEELGRITAVAVGLQKLASKLKFGLQEYSVSNVSLIQGRQGWKLITAEPRYSFFYEQETSKEKESLINFFSFVIRFLPPEENNQHIFSILTTLLEKKNMSTNDAKALQALLLFVLGYLSPRNEFDTFFKTGELFPVTAELLTQIDRAIDVSHL